jgi:hypothetical protein
MKVKVIQKHKSKKRALTLEKKRRWYGTYFLNQGKGNVISKKERRPKGGR